MIHDSCHVYLEGSLYTMPVVSKNQHAETEIVICRQTAATFNNEHYRIVLNWKEALHIAKHGYLGMALTIYATLRSTHEIEIVAEKVSFSGISDTGGCPMPLQRDTTKNNIVYH